MVPREDLETKRRRTQDESYAEMPRKPPRKKWGHSKNYQAGQSIIQLAKNARNNKMICQELRHVPSKVVSHHLTEYSNQTWFRTNHGNQSWWTSLLTYQIQTDMTQYLSPSTGWRKFVLSFNAKRILTHGTSQHFSWRKSYDYTAYHEIILQTEAVCLHQNYGSTPQRNTESKNN